MRCLAATHDIPEPSSIALEAPVCFVAPVEAQHPIRDDGPVPPGGRGALPTGSIGSLKNPSESQSSLGGQAHPSRCVKALHSEVRGGALQKCSALTWVVFFKSTRSPRRLQTLEASAGHGGLPVVVPSVPTSNSHARAGTPVHG